LINEAVRGRLLKKEERGEEEEEGGERGGAVYIKGREESSPVRRAAPSLVTLARQSQGIRYGSDMTRRYLRDGEIPAVMACRMGYIY
jgi:hypothetical protein